MHYKVLLLAISFTIPFSSAFSQKYQDFTISAKNNRVIKNDTIVSNAPKPVMGQIAAAELLSPNKVNTKKPVPLAGEQSYFGSMNEFVMDYTAHYHKAHNRTISVVKERGKTNFSLIDNVLEKHDIPKELKYLAVIESALNNNAISRVGAVGPWQFMESTARLMGLTVNKKKDERRDMYKSTIAAAKYLSYLYDELNDWLLVVAAYNSGPTPVRRAMEKTGSNNFWDIKKYLPKETQGHVLAFIATASIFENMNKFIGSANEEPKEKTAAPVKPSFTEDELKNMAIIRISEPLQLDLLSQDLKIEKRILEKWNPDYTLFETATYNAEFYSLRIPKDKLDNFIERKEFLTKRSRQLFAENNL